MSQEIERRRAGNVARRSRRDERPPEVGPDPAKAALTLPAEVEFPSVADRELVTMLIQAGASLDLMCRVRLYRRVCEHCKSPEPCPAETLTFRFMRSIAALIRESPGLMDLLVLLSTPDGMADLDVAVNPPGELPPELTARPDQT